MKREVTFHPLQSHLLAVAAACILSGLKIRPVLERELRKGTAAGRGPGISILRQMQRGPRPGTVAAHLLAWAKKD